MSDPSQLDATQLVLLTGGIALLGAFIGAVAPTYMEDRLKRRREMDLVRGAARLMQAHLKEVEIPLRVSARRSAWWTDEFMVQRFAFPDELLRLARSLEPEVWRTVTLAEFSIATLVRLRPSAVAGGSLGMSEGQAAHAASTLGTVVDAQRRLAAISGFEYVDREAVLKEAKKHHPE